MKDFYLIKLYLNRKKTAGYLCFVKVHNFFKYDFNFRNDKLCSITKSVFKGIASQNFGGKNGAFVGLTKFLYNSNIFNIN